MDCAICLPLHGPGCHASYTNSKGQAVCVFCFDGLPCAAQMRIVKQRRSPHHDPRRFAVIHGEEVAGRRAVLDVVAAEKNPQHREEVPMTVTAPAVAMAPHAVNGANKHNGRASESKPQSPHQAGAPAVTARPIINKHNGHARRRELKAARELAATPGPRIAQPTLIIVKKSRTRPKGGDSDRGFYLRFADPAEKARVKAAADKYGLAMNTFAKAATLRFVSSDANPAMLVSIVPEERRAMAGD